jgi:putative peptide zinc metalloprotease protein
MSLAGERLRSDLSISRQATRDGEFVVLKDPATARFYRIAEVEYFIASQLDGETPLETIRQETEAAYGATLPRETLDGFVGTLRRCGLLEGGGLGPASRAAVRRVRGDPLYLRIKAYDPDAFLSRWVGRLWFFFTRAFVVSSAAVILLGVAITWSNSDLIGQDLRRLYNFHAVLLAWVVVLSVTALHEFAHGLTCKHFGGEVHEMGFMLIYFQPALYCNVSDAWLFPGKRERMWVTFAGAYFEVFVWGIATVVWRVTEPDSWPSFLALVVMATSAIKSFFNLNPLIKLDGYYLLSDALEIPNLRARATRYLRGSLRRWLGAGPEAADSGRQPTRRERRIFLIYGLLAGSYSIFLLTMLGMRFGGYLTARYHAVGFFLFLGMVLIAFRRSLARVVARVGLAGKEEGKKMAAFRRTAKVIALPTLIAGLALGKAQSKVAGEFEITSEQTADVRAQVDGIIGDILVQEGDRVESGSTLALISDRELASQLRGIQAQMSEQGARARLLRAGPRAEELAVAQAAQDKAEEQLRFAQIELERVGLMYTNQLISRADYEKAEEQVALRSGDVEEARAAVAVLLAGSRTEEIEAVEAELARLAADRQYLEAQLALTHVTAPHGGIVATSQMRDKVGQYVKKGDLIAEVHDLGTVRAEIMVPEKEIAAVSVGQRVVLRPRAYPGQNITGEVVAIAPTATQVVGGRTRSVKVTTAIDNSEHLLKPAMTGYAKIYSGERTFLQLLLRRLTRYLRVEFWSWW